MTPEVVIHKYTEAYRKLYRRFPRGLQAVDNEWVEVSGVRMRLVELEYLTQQLQREYQQGLIERRSMVSRLVKWFKG